MSKPRNIKIDVTQGASKNLSFHLDDNVDLSTADIKLLVAHLNGASGETLLEKSFDPILSSERESGKFVIKLEPADTANLTPRTYSYSLQITIDTNIYKPLQGDFVVYRSI